MPYYILPMNITPESIEAKYFSNRTSAIYEISDWGFVGNLECILKKYKEINTYLRSWTYEHLFQICSQKERIVTLSQNLMVSVRKVPFPKPNILFYWYSVPSLATTMPFLRDDG
jgi:hypothetical protein